MGSPPTSNSVITGAAWCISLEFMFYMLFPFLSRFAMEQGANYLLKLLVLMLLFKLAAYTVVDHSTLMYYQTFVGRFDQFLIGMLAAFVYRKHSVCLHRYASVFLLVAGVIVLVNSTAQAHFAPLISQNPKSAFWIAWSMLESTGWSMFILAWVAFGKALPGYVDRLLCHGGKISFSFYLLHVAVIHIATQWFGLLSITGNAWVDEFMALASVYIVTWGLATLSYNTIEEPFLRMRHSYGRLTPN